LGVAELAPYPLPNFHILLTEVILKGLVSLWSFQQILEV